MSIQTFTPTTNAVKKNSVVDAIELGERLPKKLRQEIAQALHAVGGYGSIEIYVQDHSVTQITVRQIKKTKHYIAE